MWPSQAFPSGRKSLAHSSLLFLFLLSPSPLTMEKHTCDTSQQLSFPQAKLDDPLQGPVKPLCLLFPSSWPFAPYLIYFCISLKPLVDKWLLNGIFKSMLTLHTIIYRKNKLLYKDLLNSTGNYSQYLVISYNLWEKIWILIYLSELLGSTPETNTTLWTNSTSFFSKCTASRLEGNVINIELIYEGGLRYLVILFSMSTSFFKFSMMNMYCFYNGWNKFDKEKNTC